MYPHTDISLGKHAKAVHTTSAAVNSEDIGGDTLQEQYLSYNSRKHQNKMINPYWESF